MGVMSAIYIMFTPFPIVKIMALIFFVLIVVAIILMLRTIDKHEEI